MRKALYVIPFLALAIACTDKGGGDIEAIHDGWRGTTISVSKGGSNPTVMQLLKAFNTVWHTDAADSIIAVAGDKKHVTNDDGSPVFVDCDGYNTASYNHGDDGKQYLEARTYRRNNGHTLFAVCLEQTNPSEICFCCFYDYDPAKATLKPENEPYNNFTPKWEKSDFKYYLGDEYDQTIVMQENSPDGETTYHHFVFDGQNHTFSHTGEQAFSGYNEIEQTLPNTAIKKDESKNIELYANLDIEASDGKSAQWSLWIRDKRTGKVYFVLQTNDDAEERWYKMTGGNAIDVLYEEIAAGDCNNSHLLPWDEDKIFFEGCPKGREVWSYIVDTKQKIVKQFPTTQGLVKFDKGKRQIHLLAKNSEQKSVERVFNTKGELLEEYPRPDYDELQLNNKYNEKNSHHIDNACGDSSAGTDN